MELLYVWVEEYGNIRKQGFNFTNDYDVKVNPIKEKEFNVSINEKERVNIFKNRENGIIDIFGIIGKNGSGKTTIINAILSHKIKGFSVYKLEKSEGEKQYLVIYSDDLTMLIDKDNIELIDYNQEKQSIDYLVNNSRPSILEEHEDKIVCIYYDNIFNADKTYKDITRTLYDTSKPKSEEIARSSDWNDINISTSYEFFHKNESIKLNFISNETKNSISFFQNSLFKESFSIQKPDKFIIKNLGKGRNNFNENFVKKIMEIFLSQYISDYKKILEELLTFYNEYRKNDDILDSQMIEIMKSLSFTEENGEYKIKDNLYDSKLMNELFNLFLKCQKNEINENDIMEYINGKFTKINNGMSDGKRMWAFNSSSTGVIPLSRFISIMRDFWSLPDEIIKEENESEIQIDFKNEEYINAISSFLDFTKVNTIREHFFEYSYNRKYSTGELAVITFFSRFMAKYQELSLKKYRNIMVLLDEPDIYMHPEWQRKYISVLKEFFEKFYADKKIKIILTSHSPFVASDLPRENVIMLDVYDEKDEEVINSKQNIGNCKVVKNINLKTFGANIFDLYSKAFFVESSFGEFAKGKIKEVVRWFEYTEDKNTKKRIYTNESKINKEKLEYILNSIGEPLVKNKLQKMYDEYREIKFKNESKKTLLEEFKKLTLKEQSEFLKSIEAIKND